MYFFGVGVFPKMICLSHALSDLERSGLMCVQATCGIHDTPRMVSAMLFFAQVLFESIERIQKSLSSSPWPSKERITRYTDLICLLAAVSKLTEFRYAPLMFSHAAHCVRTCVLVGYAC